MKNLPIGIQEFSKLREDNCVYVDKTEIIFKLITSGNYYFLSRPRRFGKSLLVNTLKEIFLGNKSLFEDLWIYDKIDWEQHPVIKLSFANIGHTTEGLANAIDIALNYIAKQYDITLTNNSYPLKFQELIVKMSVKGKVVILIDEYDKPIIDYIENRPKAEENRRILKNFYSIIKDNDANIRFLFITGVSKFSQVSIFSDLNHLSDITLNKNFSCICGYTENDIINCFGPYLENLKSDLGTAFPNILETIKEWYNGYSWDGRYSVYNPFSILNLFFNNRFENFWYRTGTPTFLIKLLSDRHYTILELEKKELNIDFIEKYTIENLEINALLFQTGYLTIKHLDIFTNIVTLDFPNREVAQSFQNHMLSDIVNKNEEITNSIIVKMYKALKDNNMALLVQLLTTMFANITYPNIDDKEKYYHSIFYLSLKLIGFNVESEVITNSGRIDAVLKTSENIYVIEFKLGTPESAIAQIKEKKYYQKFMADGRKVVMVGIGFDTEKKNIDGYIEESIS